MIGVGLLSVPARVVSDVVPPCGADLNASAWAESSTLVHTLSISLYAGFAEEPLVLALPVAVGTSVEGNFWGARAGSDEMLVGGLVRQ